MTHSITELLDIPLELIDPPLGRVRFEISQDRIDELAQSIQEQGLLQPIVVRKAADRFEIVAGERRFLAFKQLNRDAIPATLTEISDERCAIARATENINREDLSPIEQAAVYQDLADSYNLTAEQIGKAMAKTPGHIIRRMHLLRMPPELQKAIHLRQLTLAAAEQLNAITDPAALSYYLECAIDHGATSLVCKGWVKDWKDKLRRETSISPDATTTMAPTEDPAHYVTCATCDGPMKLGAEKVLRICPGCHEAIVTALHTGALAPTAH